MKDQMYYPFFVNGEYWKRMGILPEHVRLGQYRIPVSKDAPLVSWTEAGVPLKDFIFKEVTFKYAEICESHGTFSARYALGFWVVDNKLYLKQRSGEKYLYLRE